MDCPDEDTYALLLDGRLPAARRHGIELHLDQCASCSALLSHIAKVYARPHVTQETPSSSNGPVARPRAFAIDAHSVQVLSRVQVVAAVLHALIAARFTWLLVASGESLERTLRDSSWSEMAAELGRFAFSYALAWAPIGAALALSSAWALWRRVPWAMRLTTWSAVLSLPSVVFLPLSVYVLFELRRLSGPRGRLLPERGRHR